MIGSDGRVGSSGAQLIIGDGSTGSSIRTTTGDQLLSRQVNSRALVKIDTDGNELDVLRGFNNMFAKGTICTVLVETNPLNADAIEQFLVSWNLLEDNDYHNIVDHSDHRRSLYGNVERTKIYSTVL